MEATGNPVFGVGLLWQPHGTADLPGTIRHLQHISLHWHWPVLDVHLRASFASCLKSGRMSIPRAAGAAFNLDP